MKSYTKCIPLTLSILFMICFGNNIKAADKGNSHNKESTFKEFLSNNPLRGGASVFIGLCIGFVGAHLLNNYLDDLHREYAHLNSQVQAMESQKKSLKLMLDESETKIIAQKKAITNLTHTMNDLIAELENLKAQRAVKESLCIVL